MSREASRDRSRIWHWLPLLLAPFLLWLAFRRIDLTQLVATLSNLTVARLLLLFIVNCVVLLSLSMRWWLILRALGHRVGYPLLSLFRLVAFAWSYFTPGPQFGGEPWQIYLLRSRSGVSTSEATASVGLEKSVELIANFSFLLFGLLVVLRLGVFPGASVRLLVLSAALLLAMPLALLWLARRGQRPVGWLLKKVPARVRNLNWLQDLFDLVEEAEDLGAEFLRRKPAVLLAALLASYISWMLLVAEYWLMARFLGLELTVWTAIAVLTAARVAYLLPMPGGLGTLEASQVLALAALGFPFETGAALALLIRARDVIFGGMGLLAGSILAPGPLRSEI